MEDNEKKRIIPVVVEQGGESVPSLDSLDTVEEQPKEKVSESSMDSMPDNIISEGTKDTEFEEAKAIQLQEESKPTADIGIMHPSPLEPEKKKGNKLKFLLIMLLVALVIALLAGGIYVYTQGTTVGTTLPDPTPLATETPSVVNEPTATPTEKVDVSKLKVNILNGSGKIGEAGKVKTAIEKEGFKVASTGNAATFDFEQTVIQVKEGVSESVVNMLKDSLSESYKVEIGESLKSTSTYDIVITVGSK